MKIALTPEELTFIKENIVKPLEDLNAKVYVFGSRAVGFNKKFSDLDILVKCNHVTQSLRNKIGELDEFLVNSSFPYKVDLVLEIDLAESYKENIHKQLVKL